jgi:hypothetical protein
MLVLPGGSHFSDLTLPASYLQLKVLNDHLPCFLIWSCYKSRPNVHVHPFISALCSDATGHAMS